MDLNKEQQSLLMAITMSNGCSVPNKPSSDVNKLYASGYIDIIRKANGEFYEVTDAGRDKVDEIMSINKLRYDTPLQKSKCCAQKLDSISGLYNIFEQHKDCPKNIFGSESDKVHKLMKPIYDSYLEMIKNKDLNESKLLAFEFMDEMHVMFAQARLMNAMRKRKEKQKK